MGNASRFRFVYITFGMGTPLRGRYVRVRTERPDWEVARGLFGERYATTYDERSWRVNASLRSGYDLAERYGWTELKLTGAVLTALKGGELPPADELNDDVACVRAHMAQDQATL